MPSLKPRCPDGKGIDNVCKKTSQLLHFAGMEVQDILEDLQDPGHMPHAVVCIWWERVGRFWPGSS